MPFKRIVAVVLLGLFLLGCGPHYQYAYTPPVSPEGRVCISQCLNGQQQCWNFNQNAYQQCENNRSWAMQNYYQCQDNAPDKKSRNRCMLPPACYSPSTYQCDENYRACSQACGGRVETFLVPQ